MANKIYDDSKLLRTHFPTNQKIQFRLHHLPWKKKTKTACPSLKNHRKRLQTSSKIPQVLEGFLRKLCDLVSIQDHWLLVSMHLKKYARQNGGIFPNIGVNIKHICETTTQSITESCHNFKGLSPQSFRSHLGCQANMGTTRFDALKAWHGITIKNTVNISDIKYHITK